MVAAVALAVFLLVPLFLYTWYRLHAMLHVHQPNFPPELPPDITPVTQFVQNSDGQKIAYWYFPVARPKAVVILVHGYNNPGGKSLMSSHVGYLRDAGYSTVLLDLRSHAESDGQKVFMGTEEWKDVEVVYDKIKSLPENQKMKMGIMGISMGAATSLVTAGQTQKGDFVIASVPYKSLDSLFRFQIQQNGFPAPVILPLMKLAARFELRANYEQFTPEAKIKDIHVPIIFFSATDDEQVNHQDAKDLFTLAHEPKEFYEFESGHDIFKSHPEEFRTKVVQFLNTYATK